jgi:hypothetical protein
MCDESSSIWHTRNHAESQSTRSCVLRECSDQAAVLTLVYASRLTAAINIEPDSVQEGVRPVTVPSPVGITQTL